VGDAHWKVGRALGRSIYGVREARRWFFEVWNEPNLSAFWTGTREEYFKLYRHTVRAFKDVDADLKVGGPATAHDEWIEQFIQFCDRQNLPADFVSSHHYPTDALLTPGTDTEMQLAHSRRSIMRQWAQDTRRRAGGRLLYYTEWNTSSNPRDPRHDQPYAAAFAAKTALEASGLADGYSFWTFSDIFEEDYFPSVPFHRGLGLLTVQGIAKPAYRAFQFAARAGR
jgi:xylan 1,4-beta-xylosidase